MTASPVRLRYLGQVTTSCRPWRSFFDEHGASMRRARPDVSDVCHARGVTTGRKAREVRKGNAYDGSQRPRRTQGILSKSKDAKTAPRGTHAGANGTQVQQLEPIGGWRRAECRRACARC